MSLNLSRLTPPPWEMDRHHQRDAETVYVAVHGPDGKAIFDTCNSERMEIEDNSDEDGPHYNDRIGEANLGFAALARNAFDVMMRRRIYPQLFGSPGKWGVRVASCHHISADDPFTALVEADRWLTEQENGHAKEKVIA
jgi:hypothetical protein